MKRWYAWFEENLTTQKLHPLQRVAVVGLLVLSALTVSIGGVSRVVQEQIEYILSAVLPGVIVELTNEEREAQKLGDLRRNDVLDRAAKLKAEHMKREQYFAHFSPGENISPWHWFDQAGYDYVHAGENLAIYFNDSEKVVDAWMDSPLHRDNILKSQYTEIGVAAVEGEYQGYDTVFVVQLFATPARVPQPAPAPTPAPTPVAPPVLALVEPVEETPVVPTPVTPPIVDEPVIELAPATGEAPALEDIEPVEELEILEEPTLAEAEPVAEPMAEESTATNVTMVSMGSGVALVSDHMATTTPKIPAESIRSAVTLGSTFIPNTSAFDAHDTLAVYYFIIALLVALSLIASIVLTLQRHAHAQAFYGTGLLMLLLTLVAFQVKVVEAATAVL